MATSEVSKYSVYDPRVVQTKPKYAVEKGALSLTNVSFNAQTANATSQQFNVIVPSENVFIDRAVDWMSGGVISIPVTLAAGIGTSTASVLFNPGKDVALAAFPNHQGVSQMTATINDATVTVNTQDVLNQVLRLQDVAKNRKQRTCPTMLDLYAIESDAVTYPNSPLGAYGARYATDEEPNGAFTQWWFCNPDGTTTTGTYLNAQGLPVTYTTATSGTYTAFNAYVRWQSVEKLILPPFIFGDSHELSTGLFGVQNFQVQMNIAPTPSRCVRLASSIIGKTVGTTTIADVGIPQWVTSSSLGAYAPYPIQPALAVQFLTPALDVPLPPKSIVPYMEFPRYITTGLSSIASTLTAIPNSKGVSSSVVLQSNTITLPNIPDLLLMYVKPSTPDAAIFTTSPITGSGTSGTVGSSTVNWSSIYGDFTLPIEAISINFDNFSGLLANHTQYQLYKMSVNNGVDMDFASWRGITRAYTTGTASVATSAVGGPLVLRPGRDFALQAGQAPGLVGNFTLQVNLTVGNQFSQTLASNLNLYIVPVSSGFFETIKGSSRIIKGVLTEQDILSAAPHAPEEDLERKVGAGKQHKMKGHMDAMAAYRV